MARMKRLTISMDDELYAAVEQHAEQLGITMAEVVKRCLRAQLQSLPSSS